MFYMPTGHYVRVRNYPTVHCTECGILIKNPKVWQMCRYKKNGRIYCSTSCGRIHRDRESSIRMKKRNPMKNKQTREKVSKMLKQMGHKPKVQGGNGRGMTPPQELLLAQLGSGWRPELSIQTKHSPKDGFPYCYNVDLGNGKKKIAIEIDGPSHCSLLAQKRDKKKDALLTKLGWKVLRFTNAEVNTDIQGVTKTIMSII